MTPTTPCPTCAAPSPPLLAEATLAFALCPSCAVAFWHPMPTEEDLAKIYHGSAYFERTRGGDEERPSFLQEAYRQEAFRSGRERLGLVPAGVRGRLLDIGCATGETLVVARERGFEPEGVELSGFAAQEARDRYGVRVHSGTLASAGLPAGSFAVVTLFHVLEHLRDPIGFLKNEVAPLLAPGGVLLVEVPNLDSIDFSYLREGWMALMPGEHLWHFTRDGLTGTLARAGFAVGELRTPHGDWSATKLLRYLGLSQGAIARMKNKVALPVQAGAPPGGRVASWPVELGRRAVAALTWPVGWPAVRMIERLGRGDRLLVQARRGG